MPKRLSNRTSRLSFNLLAFECFEIFDFNLKFKKKRSRTIWLMVMIWGYSNILPATHTVRAPFLDLSIFGEILIKLIISIATVSWAAPPCRRKDQCTRPWAEPLWICSSSPDLRVFFGLISVRAAGVFHAKEIEQRKQVDSFDIEESLAKTKTKPNGLETYRSSYCGFSSERAPGNKWHNLNFKKNWTLNKTLFEDSGFNNWTLLFFLHLCFCCEAAAERQTFRSLRFVELLHQLYVDVEDAQIKDDQRNHE